jgi:AraC family transcriptional regulator of adaptative response/methylated-DNA-[protein]-cysteine methyltransferase
MNSLPSVKEMHRARGSRDASYNGIFFFGVRTTGVFCKPSCPARKPLSGNVEFFSTVRDALHAGYRPCKRCRPMDAAGQSPTWLAPLLSRVEANPSGRLTDDELRATGIDPVRTRRYFLKNYGATFQAYCRARRMHAALDQLRRGAELDDVAMDHGYDSHSGFRHAFVKTFGRSPGRSRAAECVVVSWLESPLGMLLVGATDAGVCLLEFTDRRMLEGQLASLRKLFSCAVVPGQNEHIAQAKRELIRYFAGALDRFGVRLIYPGTDFQRKVWSALLRVPYSETRSYADIARAIGAPDAQRAVGLANGSNRIAILIPCHRVVNKDGKLGGYGGGLWRKKFLLALEQRQR